MQSNFHSLFLRINGAPTAVFCRTLAQTFPGHIWRQKKLILFFIPNTHWISKQLGISLTTLKFHVKVFNFSIMDDDDSRAISPSNLRQQKLEKEVILIWNNTYIYTYIYQHTFNFHYLYILETKNGGEAKTKTIGFRYKFTVDYSDK